LRSIEMEARVQELATRLNVFTKTDTAPVASVPFEVTLDNALGDICVVPTEEDQDATLQLNKSSKTTHVNLNKLGEISLLSTKECNQSSWPELLIDRNDILESEGKQEQRVRRAALSLRINESRRQADSAVMIDARDNNPLTPSSMSRAEAREVPVSSLLATPSGEFSRGKLGNAPFRPGGMNESLTSQSRMETSHAMSKRNAEFYSTKSVENSLKALGNASDAQTYFERVPPGLHAFRDSLAQLDGNEADEAPDSLADQLESSAEEDFFIQVDETPELQNIPKLSAKERQERMMMITRSLANASDDESDGTASDLDDNLENESNSMTTLQREESNMINFELCDEQAEEIAKGLPHDSGKDVETLELEVEQIAAETAELVSRDFFSECAASSSRPWTKPFAEGSDGQVWAVTTPIDTSKFDQVVPVMAKQYPFELDDFQKQAVMHMEAGESVFVAAHTSAGKTVVAEYAIAMAIRHRTRVVYTSPIKALSNQKFRDFSLLYGANNVGLITGDVSINPAAPCLVMTTEILRSMLYRGADIVRDIEWVIFDEVHYINDRERGVVWEEVIIMLPPFVNLIFLSATTPNTVEFSSWIGRTKKRRVHVIYTDKRPVPLEHFMYATGKLHKVMDGKKQFLKDGYAAGIKALKETSLKDKSKAKAGTGGNPASKKQQEQQKQQYKISGNRSNEKTERAHWLDLIKFLNKNELLPCVTFVFSKRMCDLRAEALQSLNLTTANEKGRIMIVFAKALARLHGSDRDLPQVRRVRDMTSRGVGVHHGGLLPILKEVVEILFAQGLVKVLFATESMAIGVNLPARSVVFHSLRKHDGVQMRDLVPGEYTQMAGRAGRRGLDSVGTVIISCAFGKQPPPQDDLCRMLTGKATKLSSQFRLSYAMILSLLRVAELSVADMMKRSFSEFGTQRLIGGRDVHALIRQGEEKLAELRSKIGNICAGVGDFEKTRIEAQQLLQPLLDACLSGEMGKRASSQVLCRGRVVLVTSSRFAFAPACILGAPRSRRQRVSMLVYHPEDGSVTRELLFYSSVVFVSLFALENQDDAALSRAFIELLAKSAVDQQPCSVCQSGTPVAGSGRYLGSELPLHALDPVKELKAGDIDFVQAWRSSAELARSLLPALYSCVLCPNFQTSLGKQQQLGSLESKLLKARQAISDENLALFPDFQARIVVLQQLDFIRKGDRAVQLKGRLACEVRTADELLLTEMILDDVFGPLSPAECAAVCSALVMERRCEDEPVLTSGLERARDKMMVIVKKLDAVQRKARVELDPEYVRNAANFALMEVVYEWARGLPFRDICQLTSLEEGSIVRVITRLDETCRECRNAAKIIGDAELFAKFEKASELIKRDIIFAASLYVT